VDLGSNSFRLEIGRVDHGEFQRTEYLERNRTPRGRARRRAQPHPGRQCRPDGNVLARFGGSVWRASSRTKYKAVATQTLREARNRDVFLEKANAVLGFPIDAISGREKPVLIYQGVAHMLPASDERRLVIDVGGRSTELILGQGLVPGTMESYRVGSIAWSKRYFPDGTFSRKVV